MIFVIFLANAIAIQALPKAGDSKENYLRENFDTMDTDGDGFVSKKEFRKGVHAVYEADEDSDEAISNKKINEYFKSLDSNDDKKLDFEEFKATGSQKRFWGLAAAFVVGSWWARG